MNLEASVHQIREFTNTFQALVTIGDALEDALVVGRATEIAKKQALDAQDARAKALEGQNAALEAGERIRAEAAKILADAKSDAAQIRSEAKAKGESAVAKAKEKADAIAEAAATAQEKFELQKKTNDEVLAMLGAQIAHGEAKLTEIREAIAALTRA